MNNLNCFVVVIGNKNIMTQAFTSTDCKKWKQLDKDCCATSHCYRSLNSFCWNRTYATESHRHQLRVPFSTTSGPQQIEDTNLRCSELFNRNIFRKSNKKSIVKDVVSLLQRKLKVKSDKVMLRDNLFSLPTNI